MAPRLKHRDSVLKAIAEHDRVGRQRFLDTYGFGEATRYLLRVDGRLYDSKAVVGVAFGYENPGSGPLGSHDFSGGRSQGAAAWQLEKLGFEIVTIS